MESFPLVRHPASVTDWTCPSAAGELISHHIAFPANRCVYCRKTFGALRREQKGASR